MSTNEAIQMKYDYFIAGRSRNKDAINNVLQAVRKAGHTAYCFIESSYSGDGISVDMNKSSKKEIEIFMNVTEKLEDWQNNETFKKIFMNDIKALRCSEKFIVVFPAGLAAHMEIGVAYGMGKKCYAIGKPDKIETLYLVFEKLYDDVETMLGDDIHES